MGTRSAKLSCHVVKKVSANGQFRSSNCLGYSIELDVDFDEENKTEQLSKKYRSLRKLLNDLVDEGLREVAKQK